MVGNPNRWRAAIPQLENRNSTAGCLLALLLFVPLLVKTFHISLGAIILFIAIYVSIIVPMGTGIISRKYILGRLRKCSSVLLDEQQWTYYLAQMSYISSWVHYIYLQVDGVRTFTSRMVFFVAAEKLFCPLQRFSSLYVLCFYSFSAYVQRTMQDISSAEVPHVPHSKSTAERFRKLAVSLFIWIGKIVIVTMTFFTFMCQFRHLQPSYTFIGVTFLYFCLSQLQNSCCLRSILILRLSGAKLHCLDGLEEFWVPVLIHSLAIGVSVVVFMGLIVHTNNYIILVILGYINFSVPLKYSLQPAWKMLCEQMAIISKFSFATWNNPQIREDYPCAVCLDRMRMLSARVTPCGHVFHGSCLRKCIQYSNTCPLCKRVLLTIA